MTEFSFGGFSYRAEQLGTGTPSLVLLFSGYEKELFGEVCSLLTKPEHPPLLLAEFGEVDWDRDYSPWAAAGSQGRIFEGGADRLLRFLPKLTEELEQRFGKLNGTYLCGYSLGGLFALYAAAADPERYCGAASCSGSMWFPGWTEFLREHPIHGRVYLSLGGKEKNSPDPLMASVEEKTREVKRICERTARVVFVNEPGGHFSKIPQRIARGISTLTAIK